MSEVSELRKKLRELENNQSWCVTQIRSLQETIQNMEIKMAEYQKSASASRINHNDTDTGVIPELGFVKVPDQSFLGLSKSKAFCTIVPKSGVDHKLLLAEMGINRKNKQREVTLVDDDRKEYRAHIRCAYQDRTRTWKLDPDAIKPDTRILLEFKKYDRTCRWFTSKLKRSVTEISKGGKSSEKIIFDYVGDWRYIVLFE